MTTDEIPDSESWDSVLHWRDQDQYGCVLLQLRIRAYVRVHPPGRFTFRDNPGDPASPTRTMYVSPCPDGAVEQFEREFRDAIYRYWNDKLWLVHTGDRARCQSGYRVHYKNVSCGVDLSFVRDVRHAHLVILMFYEPTGADAWRFRANCALGGRDWSASSREWARSAHGDENPADMMLTSRGMEVVSRRMYTSGRTGEVVYQQCTAAHEFGHYIGLHHQCAGAGVLNSAQQYCRSDDFYQQSSLMAVGNEIRPRYAAPWLDRLARHGYPSSGAPSRAWRGQTMPPVRPAPERCTEADQRAVWERF